MVDMALKERSKIRGSVVARLAARATRAAATRPLAARLARARDGERRMHWRSRRLAALASSVHFAVAWVGPTSVTATVTFRTHCSVAFCLDKLMVKPGLDLIWGRRVKIVT